MENRVRCDICIQDNCPHDSVPEYPCENFIGGREIEIPTALRIRPSEGWTCKERKEHTPKIVFYGYCYTGTKAYNPTLINVLNDMLKRIEELEALTRRPEDIRKAVLEEIRHISNLDDYSPRDGVEKEDLIHALRVRGIRTYEAKEAISELLRVGTISSTRSGYSLPEFRLK